MASRKDPRTSKLVILLEKALNHGTPEAERAKHILHTIYRIKIHDPAPTTGRILHSVH
jgi:hypothetical protein